MQTGRIVQAVLLIMIVAIAASCAASKEYSSKLFAPRIPVAKDSQALAFRFLDFNGTDPEKEGWVTTDIIMGRDTVSNTLALDKLSKVFPASPMATNKPNTTTQQPKTTPVLVQAKPEPVETEPVAKNVNPGEVRTKERGSQNIEIDSNGGDTPTYFLNFKYYSMKQMHFLASLLIVTTAATITSCKPSRVWATKDRDREDRSVRNTPAPHPPRYHNSVSLIISPTPGFTMNKYPDGRYFHRSPQGFLYWKGYDNRFFLDKSYLNRVSYSQWEYNEWKRYSRSQQNNRRRY